MGVRAWEPHARVSVVATISRDLAEALPPGAFDLSTGSLDVTRLLAEAIERIRETDEELDLSTIVDVHVREDYADALASLAQAVGRPITASESPDGSGTAMVLHEPDGEHIAVGLPVLLGIFSPDDTFKALSRSVLHHELCHVHDGAVHRRTLPGLWDRSLTLPDCKSAWLFPFAHDIWAEYYADRRSYPSRRGTENWSLPMLEGAVARFPSIVGIALGNLTDDTPVSEAYARAEPALNEVGPHLEYLCKHLGYVMGALAASRYAAESSCSSPAVAEVPWLHPAWIALEPHLDSMYRTHGSWTGVEIFGPLSTAVETMLERAGMKLVSPFGRRLVLPA
jgi:hypothetical protein